MLLFWKDGKPSVLVLKRECMKKRNEKPVSKKKVVKERLAQEEKNEGKVHSTGAKKRMDRRQKDNEERMRERERENGA